MLLKNQKILFKIKMCSYVANELMHYASLIRRCFIKLL